jgi:Spy/CpxP family protein refolding chaperone
MNPSENNLSPSPMKILPLILATLVLAGRSAAEPSPYAGQQTRTIKALSPEEIAGYLAGHGLGLARPAELNGYPGPRHVLDAAAKLKLTAAQSDALQTIFAEMRADAVPLGRSLVARETELDQLFASHQATEPALLALTREIGRIEGELRAVHLRAHIRTERLLTPAQTAAYNQLRGYAAPAARPRD